MSALIKSQEPPEVEAIWLTVARISAGFHRIEQLASEIVQLDAVRKDVQATQAMIRRDVAASVLQSALRIREFESEPEVEPAGSQALVANKPESPNTDEWAMRLVRWADQFGRDLFRLPSLLLPSAKQRASDSENTTDDKS